MLSLWVIVLVFSFTPGTISAAPAGLLTWGRGPQDALPELVRRIETFDSQGKALSRGSGFFIDADRVVTNRHVIENAYRVEVHSSNGNTYQVKGVLAVDAEGDIALLKVDTPAHRVRPLSLERTSPQEGESVVVIGNPFGLEGSVTNGIVSAVRDIPTFGRIIQITASISPGSSGSPVVNMRGQVIGVATLQITGGQSINFAIPSERISQLQTGTMISLADLAASTGRNKRAQAVQFFRDGLSFLSKDDCEKALPYFEKAVESDSNYAEAWAQAGFCNEKLTHHTEAIEASTKAVALRPSAESFFNIGLASYYLKQYRESADAYRQAIKLDPYNAADAYYSLGLTYREWAKPDEEIQAYKQAIRLKPDFTSAYERLGARYLRSKKYAEAIEIFKQLSVLKPGNASAPNNRRWKRSGKQYVSNPIPAELTSIWASAIWRWAIALRPSSSTPFFRTLIRIGERSWIS